MRVTKRSMKKSVVIAIIVGIYLVSFGVAGLFESWKAYAICLGIGTACAGFVYNEQGGDMEVR